MFGGIQGIIATDIQSRSSVMHNTIKKEKTDEAHEEDMDDDDEEHKNLMNTNLNNEEAG